MMEFLYVRLRQVPFPTHQVHHDFERLVMIGNHCPGISGNLAPRVKLAEGIQSGLKNLNRDTPINGVQAFYDAGLYGPSQCQILLELLKFSFVVNQTTVARPLQTGSSQVLTAKVPPVFGQIVESVPLVESPILHCIHCGLSQM